ncbi:unnamed protein product, partial [Mesorhabditis belari]|uniref:Uncharacterized protein n=1 Tax=Mesorhabditis belari TaxID=2138241 RepID=A0AAF3EAD8_9BILA
MPEVYNVPTQKSIDAENPPLIEEPSSPRKKSSFRHHGRHGSPCEKCGHINTPTYVYPVEIYPPPRPADRIRPDNRNFIGYILLLAALIFLFYVAVKYF